MLTLRKTNGFTLVELLIVIFIIGMFVTFASVNWTNMTKKGKEGLLEQFSINVSLIREDAVSNYEDRVVEYDITESKVRVGRIDEKNGFVEKGAIALFGYQLKDVVVNGTSYAMGKCYMTFHATGMIDRTIVHLETRDHFYTLLVSPLTGNVKGEMGHVEEVPLKGKSAGY